MRPLISYDDLTDSQPSKAKDSSISPPKKKQKTNRNIQRRSSHGGGAVQAVVKKTRYRVQESRQLTHEEIWDDSALIAAWDAAAEEYQALNGPDKSWKTEPVNKAPLWYNIPPEQKGADDSNITSMGMPSIPASFTSRFESSEDMEDEDEGNSRPLDFDTFVPQHDPSLSLNQEAGQTPFAQVVPPPPQGLSSVSVDEAFQNAMSAWYWAGYWTGIHHAASRQNTKSKSSNCQDGHDGVGSKEFQNNEFEARSPESLAVQDPIPP